MIFENYDGSGNAIRVAPLGMTRVIQVDTSCNEDYVVADYSTKEEALTFVSEGDEHPDLYYVCYDDEGNFVDKTDEAVERLKQRVANIQKDIDERQSRE